MRFSIKLYFVSSILAMLSISALAQTKVVVVPMSGDNPKPLANVITVASENGDFTNVDTALSSISDASASNPYLVVIAPGIYEVSSQLIIPSFVNVSGSGPGITVVRSDFSYSSPTSGFAGSINMQTDSIVENLSLEVFGTTTESQVGIGGVLGYPILISNVHVSMTNTTATYNYGVVVRASTFTIKNSRFDIASGSGTEIGIGSGGGGNFVYVSDSFITGTTQSNAVTVASEYCDFVFYTASAMLDDSCD